MLLFVLLSFTRAYFFAPSENQIKNVVSMGVPSRNIVPARYEFIFEDELDFIRDIPQKVLGERGAYVAGVMFGDKSGLDKSTISAFKDAGISHILAVSGLHAGIIMAAACFALSKVKKKVRLPILYCFLILLIVLSGFSPSVLRAGLMMGIFLIADTFGYRYNLLNSLFLTGTIILLAVPYNIFNVGFLLSFTATLGIGLFHPYLSYHMEKWGKYIGGGVSMYIACQLTSLPVMILIFGKLSLFGVVGNLFAVPIVSFALISGMIGLALYPLGLSYYPFSFSAAFMEIIEYIADVISNAPFSTVSLGSVPLVVIVFYYVIIGVLCAFAFKDRRRVYTCLGACMAIMLIWGFIAF